MARRFKKGKANIRAYYANLVRTGTTPFSPAPYGVRWMNPDNYPVVESPVTYVQHGAGNNGGSGKREGVKEKYTTLFYSFSLSNS